MTRRKKKNGLGSIADAFTSRTKEERKRKRSRKSGMSSLGRAMSNGRKKSGGGGMAERMSDALGSRIIGGRKSGASNSKFVRDAARAFSSKLSRTEYADEQERVADELENNPQRLRDELRANRLSGNFPWVRRLANWLIANLRWSK